MADQQVVEYCFSAEPAWACDAIECTKTGVEFNFEKLCQLCKAGELPEKITIYLESPQFAASEGGSGNGSNGTKSGVKSTRENESGGRPSVTVAAAADAGESLLAKEIRLANDREEMLRQERLQRSAEASRQQPESTTNNGKIAAAASGAATSGTAPVTAKPAATSSSPAAATAAAGSAGVPLSASGKLFKINEFTFSPQYKNEDPVQQDVRIALQREEEIRQQRAIGAAVTASGSKQQSTTSDVAAAAGPATSARLQTTATASARSAVRFANGTVLDKSMAESVSLSPSSSVSVSSRRSNSEQDEG